MVTRRDSVTLKLPQSVYDRLKVIKNKHNCTFSDVILMLVEMELKNNIIIEIGDYIYVTKNKEYPFRVLFKKDENIVEYYSDELGYFKDLRKWDIHARDKSMFSKFINKEGTFELLKYMGISLEFKNFIILKL